MRVRNDVLIVPVTRVSCQCLHALELCASTKHFSRTVFVHVVSICNRLSGCPRKERRCLCLLPPCCGLPQVKTMFTAIVNPEAAAFKSIRSAITCALAAHLLYGRPAMAADGAASSACGTLLGRVGAAALAEDVAELGERLAGVAAVNEAVHGPLLALLASGSRQ